MPHDTLQVPCARFPEGEYSLAARQLKVFQMIRAAARRFWHAVALCSIAGLSAAQPADTTSVTAKSIRIEAVSVPLSPQDPSVTAIGDFVYAGGLWLTCKQTDRFRELSDIVVTGQDRLTAVADGGVLINARLLFDAAHRLTGIADASLEVLTGEDGKPLTDSRRLDAEGLAILSNGDRLVSFERDHRIWLYPAGGGAPRSMPSPGANFPLNFGMEAIAVDPAVGPDAYMVGEEMTGKTWTCRLTMPCVEGHTVDKPGEFGLVAMNRLDEDTVAYLLRADRSVSWHSDHAADLPFDDGDRSNGPGAPALRGQLRRAGLCAFREWPHPFLPYVRRQWFIFSADASSGLRLAAEIGTQYSAASASEARTSRP